MSGKVWSGARRCWSCSGARHGTPSPEVWRTWSAASSPCQLEEGGEGRVRRAGEEGGGEEGEGHEGGGEEEEGKRGRGMRRGGGA